MRLLEIQSPGEFSLIEVATHNALPYAILSHTWTDGQEVTYQDIICGTSESKSGYEKIKFCGEQATRDSLRYFWVDTCCIDKSNSVELSTAINSMFRWYRNAKKCYVYLTDVSAPAHNGDIQTSQSTWDIAFRGSRWFTRGWTLQELIAPATVEFYSREHTRIGDKKSLEIPIHEITQIPVQALRGDPFSDFSIAERKMWAAQRETTEEEDLVYCLLGLCEVSMSPLYGEGSEKALFRLTDEVDKRSRNFVGRQDILEALELQFSRRESHKRVVLVGLGGVGKSQIAIEFSHRLRSQDPQTWVFWVHASTADRFEQGYGTIAAVLELPGWNDPKTDIQALVWKWLSEIRSGPWFLILDNADDTDVFSSMPDKKLDHRSRPLSSYIPQTITGSVLITTRDRRAASWLSTGYSSVIAVDLMTPKDAEELLCTKIPDGISSSFERAELVRELDYLPLAITQAAAYISARVTRMTIPRYLKLYRNGEVSQSRLLEEESGDLRRDPGVPNSVVRTWQISFDQIKEKWPSATKLLSLIALLDRQGIPDFLLRAIYPDDLDLEAALSPLEEFSLISVERGSTRFEMHRLVQLATRKWLERHQELERWQEVAVKVVSNAFPNGEYQNWEICEVLLPHAQEVLTSKFVSDTSSVAKATLLHYMGWYSLIKGRYVLASAQIQGSLSIRERILQDDDLEVFGSVGLLGLVLYHQGKYDKAEKMIQRALVGQKIALGAEHPDTLISMGNLALTYHEQGRWNEAEDLYVQVIETRQRVLGAEHPDTLTCMGNLASTYQEQGRWNKAEDLYVQVIETRQRVLGVEHPDTLTSINNLASTYFELGRWKEAEDLYVQVIETRQRALGAEHPSTLTSINNLALTWKGDGRDREALKLMKECVAVATRILGTTHPHTLNMSATLLQWQTEN